MIDQAARARKAHGDLMPGRARVALAVAVATTAALLTSGCTRSESGSSPRSSSESQPRDTESGDDCVCEKVVDVGGYKLYLRCWGEQVPGEPTVRLLSGSGPTT